MVHDDVRMAEVRHVDVGTKPNSSIILQSLDKKPVDNAIEEGRGGGISC